jgi:hypothetical protein
MENKKFYNNADRANLRANTEKNIMESFSKTFNKIKRIDENELSSGYHNIKAKYEGTSFTPLGNLHTVSYMGGGDTLLLKFSGDVPSGMKGIEIYIQTDGKHGVNIGGGHLGPIEVLMITSETANKLEDIYQEFVGRSSGIHYHREDDLSKYSMRMYQQKMDKGMTTENDGPTHGAPWNEPEEPDSRLSDFVESLPPNFASIVAKLTMKLGDHEFALEEALRSLMESGETSIRSAEEHAAMDELIANDNDTFLRLLFSMFPALNN